MHCRDVVEKAVTLDRPFAAISYYFRINLLLRWDGGELSFPWYDTWMEMDNLLGWLPLAEDGDDWWDVDQGWDMTIIREGPLFFFREGEGEGEASLAIALEREPLLRSVRNLRDKLLPIIDKVSVHLGADVFTKHTYGETIVFGTSTWNPAVGGIARPGTRW